MSGIIFVSSVGYKSSFLPDALRLFLQCRGCFGTDKLSARHCGYRIRWVLCICVRIVQYIFLLMEFRTLFKDTELLSFHIL
jgi:hypothetical protein